MPITGQTLRVGFGFYRKYFLRKGGYVGFIAVRYAQK